MVREVIIALNSTFLTDFAVHRDTTGGTKLTVQLVSDNYEGALLPVLTPNPGKFIA
jgi:hypothetical protein